MTAASAPFNPVVRWGSFVLLGGVLIWFACVNLFSDFKPLIIANDKVANALVQTTTLPPDQQKPIYAQLRMQQEALLIQNPIEPYAWMRLAFLRQNTVGDRFAAFDALRFADKIAHPDNAGGLERILMWHEYADIQTAAEKARENEMWRAAYQQGWWYLYETVLQHRLLENLKAAVMEDPVLSERWNKQH